jgi:hypothetical protein
MNGKNNIAIGFLTMGLFMAYGFLLIYLRDFAPGKEEWVNSYSIGKHFESRLAHVHGNLFAFSKHPNWLSTPIHFRDKLKNVKTISWLALDWLTNANWNINRGVFWSASCISINWSNCNDRICNLVRSCVLKNEIYRSIIYKLKIHKNEKFKFNWFTPRHS